MSGRFSKTTVNILFRKFRQGGVTSETVRVTGWGPRGVNVAVIRNPSGAGGWQVVRASDGCLLCYADSQEKARTIARWVAEAAEAGLLDPSLIGPETWLALMDIRDRAIKEGVGY